MKYLPLMAMVCTLLASANATAQENEVASFYYDDEIPGVVFGVSGNGRWAVGNDEGVVANNSFVWTRETGFTDIFGINAQGVQVQGLAARLYGIADDGTAVGVYEDGTVGLSSNPIRPGVYKDGEWTPLPTLIDLFPGDLNGYATAISADGSIICGHVPASVVTNDVLGNTVTTAGPCVPVIWVDGEILRVDDVEYEGYGAWIQSMNADGTVMCGYADFGDGSRSPAVFKDGQLIRLIGTTPASSDPNKWEGFFEGRVYAVSPDGSRVGGYFSPIEGQVNGFVWDVPETITSTSVESDEVEFLDGIATAVDANGRVYIGGASGGNSSVVADGQTASFIDYFGITDAPHIPAAIMGISADARTFATSFVMSNQMGAVQFPMVVSFDGASGIEDEYSDGLALSYAAGHFTVEGNHGGIIVYTTGGLMVKSVGSEVSDLDLSSLGDGIYLVKVLFDGGHKVMKVVVD